MWLPVDGISVLQIKQKSVIYTVHLFIENMENQSSIIGRQRGYEVTVQLTVRLHFSRILAAALYSSAVLMLDTPCCEVAWRILATHCIRKFPFHFSYLPSPCAITYQLHSTSCLDVVPHKMPLSAVISHRSFS